jgi:hypothetical protein
MVPKAYIVIHLLLFLQICRSIAIETRLNRATGNRGGDGAAIVGNVFSVA